ncbi:MAG TPA: antitoxin MazE family protein [Dehalococcoidia bacterium]|nr:antitoxin MazE family protein [Dehalococcoidia bacterium]
MSPAHRRYGVVGKRSSKEKAREHRLRLRAEGLRRLQIWVPDVRSPAFKAEARRQSALAAQSPMAKEEPDFVDALSEFNE